MRRSWIESGPASSPSKASAPSPMGSSPAIKRRRVVLPEPEGPSRATSSPGATDRSTESSTRLAPKLFDTPLSSMPRAAELRPPTIPAFSVPVVAERGADAPFEGGFEAKRDQRQKGKEGRQSEGCPD